MRAYDQYNMELIAILLAGTLTAARDGTSSYPTKTTVDACYRAIVGLVGTDSDRSAINKASRC